MSPKHFKVKHGAKAKYDFDLILALSQRGKKKTVRRGNDQSTAVKCEDVFLILKLLFLYLNLVNSLLVVYVRD